MPPNKVSSSKQKTSLTREKAKQLHVRQLGHVVGQKGSGRGKGRDKYAARGMTQCAAHGAHHLLVREHGLLHIARIQHVVVQPLQAHARVLTQLDVDLAVLAQREGLAGGEEVAIGELGLRL